MIVISTDSGSDLSADYARENGVYIAPMHVIMDGVSYDDGAFPVEDIMRYYDRTGKIPTTSGSNVADYTKMFGQINSEHPGCIILHICYSAVTTVSYQNATLACRDFPNVHLVDAKNVTVGLGIVVRRALAMREAYGDEDITTFIRDLEELATRVRCSFIPNTLDYLLAGGRISNVAYISANFLRLKPLIKLENGYLVAKKKYRGTMARILPQFWRDFLQAGPYEEEMFCYGGVVGVEENLMTAIRDLSREAGFHQVIRDDCGCVISCHGGPGAIGIAAIAAKPEAILP